MAIFNSFLYVYQRVSPWNNYTSLSGISCAKGHTRSDSSSLMRWCDRNCLSSRKCKRFSCVARPESEHGWNGGLMLGQSNTSFKRHATLDWLSKMVLLSFRFYHFAGFAGLVLMQNGKWTKPNSLSFWTTMFLFFAWVPLKRMWFLCQHVSPQWNFYDPIVPQSQLVQIDPGVLHGLVEIENRSTDGAQ